MSAYQERLDSNAKEIERSFEWLLSHKEGRLFLWNLISKECNANGGSYTVGLPPEHTAYLEGQRSIGIDLIERAQAKHPRLWVQVITEQMNELALLEELRKEEERDGR